MFSNPKPLLVKYEQNCNQFKTYIVTGKEGGLERGEGVI